MVLKFKGFLENPSNVNTCLGLFFTKIHDLSTPPNLSLIDGLYFTERGGGDLRNQEYDKS